MTQQLLIVSLCVQWIAWCPSCSMAADPLHLQIDQLIEADVGALGIQGTASDAEFVRRVYLDLAGRIPTRQEFRVFVEDTTDQKRSLLIDRLLAGADYPRHMQEWLHAMLMERRGDDAEWIKFLRTAVAANRPWDQLIRDILLPNREDESRRGAAFFMTKRLVSEGAMAPIDVPGLTRDVGRLLAGVNLQCAQCHDHISISQYKQQDFQGLHMIFENVATQGGLPFPAVTEKVLAGKKDFMSVFTLVPMKTGLVVPGGTEIEVPVFEKGQEYLVPPDPKSKTPGTPKFSPLAELAAGLTSNGNKQFSQNIANRLWFVLMGRGLVEPLDLFHNENPPTHPKLLNLLAEELTAHGFDLKWFMRELALTKTYQRTSLVPVGNPTTTVASYTVANEKRLSAEQLFWSVLMATGEADRLEAAATLNHEKSPCVLAANSVANSTDVSPLENLVAAHADLKTLQKQFQEAFANPPQEPEIEFEPSVKAALYLMNGDQILRLLKRQPGNLIDRVSELKDDAAASRELFLAILQREPSAQDLQDCTQYLSARANDREAALGRVAWSLLTTTEFCVNH